MSTCEKIRNAKVSYKLKTKWGWIIFNTYLPMYLIPGASFLKLEFSCRLSKFGLFQSGFLFQSPVKKTKCKINQRFEMKGNSSPSFGRF